MEKIDPLLEKLLAVPAEEDAGFIDKLNLNEEITEKKADFERGEKYPKERMPERTDTPQKNQ
jgi:hypothetical protein